MLHEFIEQLALGAIAEFDFHQRHLIFDHIGADARYVLFSPIDGLVRALVARDGERLVVPREMRMLVEPVDAVRMRAYEQGGQWVTQ